MIEKNALDELVAANQEVISLASQRPQTHASIAYLHDAQRKMYRFAMVSIDHMADSLIVGIEARYNRVSPMIKAGVELHDEMMEYYLPHYGKRCPDGWLVNNPTCAVFELTYDQAVSCLNLLNPHVNHRIKEVDRNIINEYYKRYDEKTVEAMYLQIQYERCCRNLIEDFLNANVKQESILMHKQIELLELTISDLQEENRKLKEALDLAACAPNFSKIKKQIEDKCKTHYVFLETPAMESLIEGELIYHTLSVDGACLDSVVASYGKVVEAQLKKHLQERKPEAIYNGITLGAIIYAIRDNCVAPYHKSFDIYMSINAKRVMAAHIKPQQGCQITKKMVEELRQVLFDQKVLDQLK